MVGSGRCGGRCGAELGYDGGKDLEHPRPTSSAPATSAEAETHADWAPPAAAPWREERAMDAPSPPCRPAPLETAIPSCPRGEDQVLPLGADEGEVRGVGHARSTGPRGG